MDTRFPCTMPGCGEVFLSVRARTIHNQKHREFYKMKYPDGREEVLYKEDCTEKFFCPVETCLQSFSRGDNLRRHYYIIHVDKVEEETQVHPHDLLANQGLCITPDPSHTPQILLDANLCVVRHEDLLVHYEDLLLLICTTCHSTISLFEKLETIIHHVHGHQSGSSKRRQSYNDYEDLKRSLEGFAFTSPHHVSMLSYTKDPLPTLLSPVPGLVIVNGFSCKRCMYYCGVRATMSNHRLTNHPKLSFQDIAIECQVQRIMRDGFGLKYFGVLHHNLDLDMDHDGAESMVEMIVNEFADHFQSLQVQMDPPMVELAPWLAESRWHEIAIGFMPKGVSFVEVKAQIYPTPKGDKSPLSYVGQMVLGYMNEVQDLIRRGVDYRLRRLVEQTTMNEEVTRGFNPLYVTSSRERYSDLMTDFILCLLRSFMHGRASVIHIFHTNRDDLDDALGRLLTQLTELEGELVENVDLGVLHEVMLGIWTPEIPKIFEATTSGNCIVTRFLILGSLVKVRADTKAEEYAFRHVRYLTQPMAMLKYWAKAVLLMHMGQSFWHESPETLLTEEVDNLLSYIKDVALPTPFNSVCQWLRLAHHITAGEPMLPRLVPLDNTHSSCLLDGELITLTMFQDMVQAIIREACAIMRRDVLIGMRSDWIDEALKKNGTIKDVNLNNDAPLYSFVTDPANRVLCTHRNDLLKHLFSGSSKGHFILGRSDQNKFIWNEDSLRKWMISCADLQERLNLLIHFVAALPSRGEEYKSFNMRNTATGSRSFFWDMLGAQGPTLMILQTYHKGANGGTPMKPTLKYIPLALRDLFLTYFSMVRPLQSYVAKILWGPEVALMYEDSWFVEMDNKLSGEDLSASIWNAFLKHCGVPFGLSEYRQLASFFSTRIREQHVDILDDLVDVNGGHTIETVGGHYARSSKDHKYIDGPLKRGHQLVIQKWHRLSAQLGPPKLTTLGEENIPHTPPVSVLHPMPADLDVGSPNKARIVCYQVYQGSSSSTVEKGIDESLVQVSEEVSAQAHLALRTLGYQTWRSAEQATAVALAIENKVDFVAILPTGSGKSLVFMAPSTMGEKTMIVVVPLKSLLYGHRAECSKMGISHATFMNGAPLNAESAPSIVFVAVETTGGSAFQNFANHLNAIGRLQAIVLDEIHTLQSSYRPAMRNLLQVMTVKCQIIGLTTSLSPGAQVEVERILDAPFRWIRSATVRPNIQYMAMDVQNMNEEIVRRLSEWKITTRSLDTDRAIVYCLTREDVEATAMVLRDNNLGCAHMHAGSTTAESVKSLKTWEHSKGCEILIATGVVGCGFHYSSVTLVIHKGGFRSLTVFHQESGRAGRDGLLATSCTISNVDWRKEALCMDSTLEIPWKWIEEKERCRRIALHATVDGKPQMCYLIPGAVPCNHCSQGAQERPVPMNVEEASQGIRVGRHEVPLQGNMPGATPRTDATFEPTAISGRSTTQLQQNGLSVQAPTAFEHTVLHRLRPELTRGRIEEVRGDIRLIRKYAGDHGRCLMCWSPRANTPHNHVVLRCPFVRSKCARCLQSLKHHSANRCANKIVGSDTCFKCHFPHQPDNLGFHQGPYGSGCQDTCGERLRLFMWKAWRYNNLNDELCRALPEIRGFSDVDLCQWLPSSHPGTLGNNFV